MSEGRKSYDLRSRYIPRGPDSAKEIDGETSRPSSPVQEWTDTPGYRSLIDSLIVPSTPPTLTITMASPDPVAPSTGHFNALMQAVPMFDGSTSTDIDQFFAQLVNVASLGEWTDDQKISIAKCRMTGAALDLAQSEALSTLTDFGKFKDAILKRSAYIYPPSQLRKVTSCVLLENRPSGATLGSNLGVFQHEM